MATTPTVTTELNAVNTMLGTLGASPVNSLSGEANLDLTNAVNVLSEISVAVQSQGWHFNTEINYPLTPDNDGAIDLPANCVRVDTMPGTTSVDVVQRGTRLYDRISRSYTFENQLKARMVLLRDFDELPETVRHYIAIRAARVFQDRFQGDNDSHIYTERDEKWAKADMVEAEGDTAGHNIMNSMDPYRAGIIR